MAEELSFISLFGVPLEIHSDPGRNFQSALFQDVCHLVGTQKTTISPLQPHSGGMVAMMNELWGNTFPRWYQNIKRDWDQYLHYFLMAYRSSINETIGQTPACLMFVCLPFDCKSSEKHLAGEEYVNHLKSEMNDIHDFARKNIQIASDRMKDRYDIRFKDGGFELEDLSGFATHNNVKVVVKVA